jgi:amidase
VSDHGSTTGNDASTPPWQWTATFIAEAVRTRQVSAREVVESCIGRIEETNPKINALTDFAPDEALAMADAADEALRAHAPLGPLHGVPVSIKINADQAGHATSDGVVAFKDNIASQDSPPVAALRRAGAVLLGRSNSPDFSYRWFTDNDLYGRTLNPWDASRTPGGSSGGAAAAVAVGMMPIGHGNDIAGSIRYPAFGCGIVGIRPTVGRVSGTYGSPDGAGPLCHQMILVQGPLARNVPDLRIALGAMSQFDPRDPVFAAVPTHGEALAKPIKVGLLRDIGVCPPVPAVNDALNLAGRWLEDAGYIVEEVSLPLFEEAYRLWWFLCMEEFRLAYPVVKEIGGAGVNVAAANYFTVAQKWWGTAPSLADYINGYGRRAALIRQLQTFMQDYPLILLPTSAQLIQPHDTDIRDPESCRNVMQANWSMNAIPILGHPAISVPTGNVGGLPVGVQLLGRRFREDTLFDAADIIEAQFDNMTPIDPRPSPNGSKP